MEKRADIALVERGLATTRTQAQKMIHNDQVKVRTGGDWQLVKKPSAKLFDDDQVEVFLGAEQKYVSRAGLKLEHALRTANITIGDHVALDVGQSTGGFTDCLLQHGCHKVIGIDVGSSQLHESLRLDSRVHTFEGVNARYLCIEQFVDVDINSFDLVVMDVSFISQTLILPCLPPLMKQGATLVSLVKPQFEVGRQGIGKGGLVKNTDSYGAVESTIKACCAGLDLVVADYFESSILGGDGNKEFFIIANKT